MSAPAAFVRNVGRRADRARAEARHRALVSGTKPGVVFRLRVRYHDEGGQLMRVDRHVHAAPAPKVSRRELRRMSRKAAAEAVAKKEVG